MSKPHGPGSGASANGARERGSAIRQRADAHRASKGSRADRLEKIRGRANTIAGKLTDRSARHADDHNFERHKQHENAAALASATRKGDRSHFTRNVEMARSKADTSAAKHAHVTRRADSLKHRIGRFLKQSGRENRGISMN